MILSLSGTYTNIIIDIFYSIIGFILGWIAGRIGREVAKEHPKPNWYPSARTGLGILILIMTTYTMISGVVSAQHDRQVTACQTQLNDTFREALIQRANSATVERAAQRKLLLIQLDPTSTVDVRKKAIIDYLASLDAADKQRNDFPLPTNWVGCE